MREEVIWAALHKLWEEDYKGGRILRQLQTLTTGVHLWELTEPELVQQFPQVPAALWQKLTAQKKQINLDKVEAYFHQHALHILLYTSPDYPALLKDIHQPPALLYWKGNLAPASLNDCLKIAIVGSRKADRYGLGTAEQLAEQLSQAQVCVVSGLARGVDASAHRGALKGSGGTIAVQGCGMDQIYPREHRKLAEEILAHERGCVISEYPLGSPPIGWHFPQRNRIISGLSQGTVIVQAAVKSGAFITVENALEQGRDVFAVPGQIDNALSAGPNRFLQEGARLVTCAADILAEYEQQYCLNIDDVNLNAGYQQETLFSAENSDDEVGTKEQRKQKELKNKKLQSNVQHKTEPKQDTDGKEHAAATIALTKEEEQVLQYFTAEPITIEEVAYLSRMSMAELMPILSMLELYDLIQQMVGRKYIRVG